MEEQMNILGNTQLDANKGTGAGGANTNFHGKKFEETTNNEGRLMEQGFVKHTSVRKLVKPSSLKSAFDYYLSKTTEDKTITYTTQHGFKQFVKCKYNIDVFRCPDEAYVVEYSNGQKTDVYILEKKEQRMPGSVETKLWAAALLKREYEIVLGNDFIVHYGLCVSQFLENLFTTNKKYQILQQMLHEIDIVCLFGDNANYFTELDLWLTNNSL